MSDPLSFYIPFLTEEVPFLGGASQYRPLREVPPGDLAGLNPGLLPPLHIKVIMVCMTTKDYGILTIMVFWVSNSVKLPAS